MLKFFLLIVFSFSNGFLLDTGSIQSSGGLTPGYKQYLTMSDLYDTKTELQNGIDQVARETKSLRHDVDNKLNMFTSQVQQILASFKLEADKNKNLSDSHSEYNELMHNHTYLQHEFESLKNKYAIQQQIILANQNKMIEIEKNVAELKNLKNIQQLGDLQSIRKQIQQVSLQTQSLSVNERARRQDFQALYNMTLHSETNIKELTNMTGYLDKKMQDSDMTLLLLRKNITDSDYKQNEKINKTFQLFQEKTNKSLAILERTVLHSSEKVAMTACSTNSDGGSKSSGITVTFGDVVAAYNIKNLTSLSNIGKFDVEVDGLYLISAWLFSRDVSKFSIRINGTMIASAYMSAPTGSYSVATAVVVQDLKRFDTIWVQTEKNLFIFGDTRASCLTFIKVN